MHPQSTLKQFFFSFNEVATKPMSSLQVKLKLLIEFRMCCFASCRCLTFSFISSSRASASDVICVSTIGTALDLRRAAKLNFTRVEGLSGCVVSPNSFFLLRLPEPASTFNFNLPCWNRNGELGVVSSALREPWSHGDLGVYGTDCVD